MRRVLLYVPLYRDIPVARESWFRQQAPDTWVDIYLERYNPLPNKGVYANLDIKSEYARNMALTGEYDYLFNVEDDIVLPDDALEKLLTVDNPIVSGLTRGRGAPVNDGSLMTRIYVDEVGEDIDERQLRVTDIKNWGDVIECTAVSLCCLLLQRSILPALEGIFGRDYILSKKAYALDIKMLCHTGVLCGHVNEMGEIIGVRTHGNLSPHRLFDCSP